MGKGMHRFLITALTNTLNAVFALKQKGVAMIDHSFYRMPEQLLDDCSLDHSLVDFHLNPVNRDFIYHQ